MHYFKKVIYIIWIGCILIFPAYLIWHPELLTAEGIETFLNKFTTQLWIVFTIIIMLRGIFLIPGIPFVLAGSMVFPKDLITVLAIAMAGVVFSATIVYYFSDLLGFNEKLRRRYPKRLPRWEERLQQPYAAFIVLGWSFFPLVPTNIICYLGGIVKMRFLHILLGVFFGELILNICLVFFGQSLLDLMF